MKSMGVTPNDICGIKDLHKLPFITKDDLKESYPFGFFAVDSKKCIRVQSTSGTTDKRVIAGYTQADINL